MDIGGCRVAFVTENDSRNSTKWTNLQKYRKRSTVDGWWFTISMKLLTVGKWLNSPTYILVFTKKFLLSVTNILAKTTIIQMQTFDDVV